MNAHKNEIRAVMLRASGKETSQTILAHGEEAVAKEFVRHLKQAIRQVLKGMNSRNARGEYLVQCVHD